ncbi:MAG: hypothetical protein AB1642_09060 [Pseudomonadota bacterium]
MADADDVFSQADALMRRHRSFVARAADAADPLLDEAAEIDIPVLTEVVSPDAITPRNIDAVLDALRQELDDALSAWLVEVLPVAVTNASQQILAELDAKARHTLLPRLREIVAARREDAEQGEIGPSL